MPGGLAPRRGAVEAGGGGPPPQALPSGDGEVSSPGRIPADPCPPGSSQGPRIPQPEARRAFSVYRATCWRKHSIPRPEPPAGPPSPPTRPRSPAADPTTDSAAGCPGVGTWGRTLRKTRGPRTRARLRGRPRSERASGPAPAGNREARRAPRCLSPARVTAVLAALRVCPAQAGSPT